MPGPVPPVVAAERVTVIRDGMPVLEDVSLEVRPGERWVVLGPNGCGKSTLLSVLSLWLHPSSGTVTVNGAPLGSFDARAVRARIGHCSAALGEMIRPALTALDAVMTARHGALETWWHKYTPDDLTRAGECLARTGCGHLAERPLGTLSSGQRQRVLIARALMAEPVVLLMDEPGSQLDLGGREDLVATLDALAASDPGLPTVMVSHHVDEIPASTTHCLLMCRGRVHSAGPLDSVLTPVNLSECFGLRLTVERRTNGRFSAWAC